MKLSIVVPAHNEEKRIGRMLDAYLPYFCGRYRDDVEFIVVINGTTDATEKVVSGYCETNRCIRVLVDPNEIGKGGAVIQGCAAAEGELIGYTDADGATPPEAFEALVQQAASFPVVIASRWLPGAVLDPPQPPARRVASRIFNLLTRILFGLRLTDTQCGAKVMRREVAKQICPQITTFRWVFDVDLLLQAKRAGYGIKEVPTVWHHQPGSKMAIGASSVKVLAALIRLRLSWGRAWAPGVAPRAEDV